MAPDVVSYGAVANSCAKAGQWRRALQLLEEIETDGKVKRKREQEKDRKY